MWRDAILDLLFPMRCTACDGLTDGEVALCALCAVSLVASEHDCPACGAPAELRLQPSCCDAIAPLDRLGSSFLLGGELQRAIWRFKYERQPHAADALASLMWEREPGWLRDGAPELIVHVPSSAAAMRRRGYNPAGLLAESLGRRLGVSHLAGALTRSGRGRAQMKRSGSERRQAVQQTPFRVANAGPLVGRRLLLIDDVVTTGTTLRAVARALKKAGATRVEGWTLAATERCS